MLVHKFFKRLRFIPLFLCITALFLHTDVKGNTEPNPQETSYVVIGAFMYHNNAIKFVSFARKHSLDAEYAMNTIRNLYYVYVFSSPNVDDAIREVNKVRSIGNFDDAWVYTGALGKIMADGEVVAINTQKPGIRISKDDMTTNTSASIRNNTTDTRETGQEGEISYSEGEAIQTDEENAPVNAVSDPEDVDIEDNSTLTANTEEPNKEIAPGIEKEEGYYYLYFNTLNTKKYKEVKGKVKIVDPERAKELAEVKSHELVKLKDPNNGTRRIQLITDIFGFKEVQHIINLDNPVNDSTEAYVDVIGDSIVVDFDLSRFKKGDVLIMYNVYFYIDAAIMKPESIYELNSLLDMLNENEDYKVKIHGHTNGSSTGKIIHLDNKDKNYFSLSGEHKESVGSAKKLSLYRAYTIQEWLIEQGVDPKRMEIRGWGGKKMIYDKFDSQAYKNVRVEIEITDD